MTFGAGPCVCLLFCASECCIRSVDPFGAISALDGSRVFFLVGDTFRADGTDV